MSAEGLIVIALVGIIAGWLAAKLVRGGSLGLVGALVVGVLGALVGGWLLPRAGVHIDPVLAVEIVTATVGAIVLLLVLRLVRRI